MKKENVWDYPRPAICEPFDGTLKVIINNVILAETSRGYRTLETSHPPTYYFPREDIRLHDLKPNTHVSMCEWKGKARYFDFVSDKLIIENVGWCYEKPTSGFEPIQNYISFYASKVDECFVNDERIASQEGDFYGGWITSNLQGPFKGGKNTWGW